MPKKKNKLYAVIGLGRFGFALAGELSKKGCVVLAVDCDRQKVNAASEFTLNAFVVNELTSENLEEAGVGDADVAVICIGEKIDVSILTTLTIIRLGVPEVIAKATSPEQGDVLKMLGAKVVYPERDMALRLAAKLSSPHILEYISLSDSVDIMEILITEKAAGKTVLELNVRKNYGLNIIAVNHAGEMTTDISPETEFALGDTVTVIGKTADVAKFEDYLAK